MTNTFKFAIGPALALALASQPAFAQAAKKPAPAPVSAPRTGPIMPGVGVADLQAAMAKSNAYRVAQTNRQNTYRPTLDAAQARARQIDAQLKPLIDQFSADRAAKKPDAVLQGEYAQIQSMQAAGEAEIKTMLAPIELSEAYVREQIADKMGQAVNNVMSKRGITLLLGPDAVILASQNYDVTDAVVAELNLLVPSVQIVPPAGWVPRAQREAQAQQQQGQPRPAAAPAPTPAGSAPAPAPRPAGPLPEGR